MKLIKIVGLLSLILISSCRDNIDTIDVVDEIPEPRVIDGFVPKEENVNASVEGLVVDENAEVIIGAEVTLGSLSTQTDDYGHFFFEGVTMNKAGTYIEVERTGYFKGSRRFFPLDQSNNQIKIELIPLNYDQSFPANAGGEIDLTGGAKINFEPNSIQDENGNLYAGTVEVATQWLDPSNPRTFDQMPGSLQGVNFFNEEVALATFGMIAVELQGSGGESLNIASGSAAEISLPIPSALQANAPQEIPLWSFNEEFGIWVEEGMAEKVNNNYVGLVSHFSFWNCDAPFDLIRLDLQLLNEQERPLPNYRVEIERGTSRTGSGYSDQEGKVSGLVPAGENLLLNVYGRCNELLYTQELGPYGEDTDIGAIIIPDGNINTTIVRGEILNCNNEVIQNGLIIARFAGNSIYQYIEGESFEMVFNTCPGVDEVSLFAIDLDNQTQSETIRLNPSTETNVGLLEVCNRQVDNYIQITVDGVTKFYPNATIQLGGETGTSSYIEVTSPNQAFYIGIGFSGNSPGDYSDANFLEAINDQENNWFLRGDFSSFIVTDVGADGGPVKGSFSGTLTNREVPVQVQGVFSIIP